MVQFAPVEKFLNRTIVRIRMRQCQDQNCLGKLSIRSSSCCCAGGRHRMWSRRGRVGVITTSTAHPWLVFGASPVLKAWADLGEHSPEDLARKARGASSAAGRALAPSTALAETKSVDCAPRDSAIKRSRAWLAYRVSKLQIFSATEVSDFVSVFIKELASKISPCDLLHQEVAMSAEQLNLANRENQ